MMKKVIPLLLMGVFSTSASSIEANKNTINKASELAPYQKRSFQDEVFYFVLPDRFYNGDPSNDLGAPLSDKKRALSHGGLDKTHKGMYHGGDLTGLTEKLPYLDEMGITAIWLTPILRNQAMQNGTSGYHGYWILDFTEIDPHLGSNENLKQFIAQAHKRNIKVFFDIITNHTADVIRYTECHGESGLEWLIEEGTCPFKSLAQMAKGDKYSPFIIPGQENIKTPQWLNSIDAYHNQGDSHWKGESSIRGDFAGLDDVDTNSQHVVDGMIDIYKDIIDEFRPDGFRIDTVKHVNMEFWQSFSPALMKHAQEIGIENFFMFGEVYSFEPQFLSRFTQEGTLPSVLDFALQGAIEKALVDQGGTDELANLFAQDHYYKNDQYNANQLVNFTGNHDMGRFAFKLKQSKFGYSEEESIQRNLLAHALMYFTRGVPVIYYGDEQGFVGDGGDQDSRQDMMPSLVETYNDDDLLATDSTTKENNFDRNHPFYVEFSKYSKLYQQYPALRFGEQSTLFSQKEAGLFVIKRELDSSNKAHANAKDMIVVFTTSNASKEINFDNLNTKVKLVFKSNENSKASLSAPLSFSLYEIK